MSQLRQKGALVEGAVGMNRAKKIVVAGSLVVVAALGVVVADGGVAMADTHHCC